MFTLRFMNGGDTTVVAGIRYDTKHILVPDQTHAKGAIVTVYPQMTSDSGGVEFRVNGDCSPRWGVCWVENAAGKTIDRIGPFGDETVVNLS